MFVNESAAFKAEMEELKENVDQIFLITNACFVCLMQCGFACLEAGAIRSKNATNILMKNIMDIFISCLAYWLIGYAFAYGTGNGFIGWTYWAGLDIPDEKMGHWFFQFVFAATAATIVSGAVAERCNFIAYIVYSFMISGFIYPVVSHWVWSEQAWLTEWGYADFAGSGAVHLLGGTASFVGALLLGPRIGRFEGTDLPGHSTPLQAMGGMILIAGFLAFNGGSLGNMTTSSAGATVSKVVANTVLGGTGSSLVSMFALKLGLKTWNFGLTLNAALAGMVSVCAAVDKFVFWSAFVSGVGAAPAYFLVHYLMIKLKVDDPLDAVAVHLGGGLWGLISGPLFQQGGIVYGPSYESFMQLVHNLAGAGLIFLWTSVLCLIMFGILKAIGYLRVSEDDEVMGLDLAKHNEPAYPVAGWGDMDRTLPYKIDTRDAVGAFRPKSQQHYTNHGYSDYERRM